mgnify:CR=1 FL=1
MSWVRCISSAVSSTAMMESAVNAAAAADRKDDVGRVFDRVP